MSMATRWLFLMSLAACSVSVEPGEADDSGRPFVGESTESGAELHGRVDEVDGLRILRTWGTPQERGYAHGYLLASDICTIMTAEFAARFAAAPALLEQARKALPRLIEYPEPIAAELDALWQGVLARKVDRAMPSLGRDFDRTDLLVANALDVFGLMGCSSFTVWGDQVDGGGVLTARNFDWPLTGDHMLEHTILIVQATDGWASASVSWPGYVGTVTGVSAEGVAAYLHVGTGAISLPQPSSWPSAIAARAILEAPVNDGERFELAAKLLDYTSPPVGFLTHVVLPEYAQGEVPAALFETDTKKCVTGSPGDGPFVVTNHFQTREDGRRASRDSTGRQEVLSGGITGCFDVGDKVVDTDEAWQMLSSVGVGGGHGFGTLHSLVFRDDPWFFELRIADHAGDGLVAAPDSKRRYRLSREQVFGLSQPVRLRTTPRDMVTYKATALADGRWQFEYPEGPEKTVGEVWVEAGRNVQFILAVEEGFDETVGFYLPAARVKRDAFPGRYQTIWFRPEKPGDMHAFMVREGVDGSESPAVLHVVDAETFSSQPWKR